MGLYGFGAALGGIVVMWAISFLIRYVNDTLSLKRLRKADAMDRDGLVASLRLRLPEGSELVALEHQMYFMDERNRAAAAEVFLKNGFETKTAETYERETRFWLMATRSALVDRVPDELLRVAEFSKSYGGRYDRWNPLL
jgi:hypothetical protein